MTVLLLRASLFPFKALHCLSLQLDVRPRVRPLRRSGPGHPDLAGPVHPREDPPLEEEEEKDGET